MTIIVGYTDSEPSRAALDFGLELGAKLAMRVVVINAGPGAEHRAESQLNSAQTEQLEQYLTNFQVSTEFRQYARGRSTADEFKDVVAELDPYLVVIGGAKRSGFAKFIMGSVADELLRELVAPVLSVKVPEVSVVSSTKE